MKLTTLTKGEAQALWDCALNMKDDLEFFKDVYSKAKYKKFLLNYETGMNKLFQIFKSDAIAAVNKPYPSEPKN